MPIESEETAGPVPAVFAGNTPAQVLRRLFAATRPKFFPASVLPVVVGSAWGASVAGTYDIAAFALALLATLCVHAGANVLNDVGDESGGTDRCNEDRIYPYTGGSRFIQAGIMSAPSMARLGISLLAVAAVAGLMLLLSYGAMILWFGVVGVALAVLYSLGPVRLSSIGLGEIAVGVGLGILPVTGAAWLQSGTLDVAAVLFSLPVAVWVAAILLINEVPDIRADEATGKRTLPVRLGLSATANLYFLIQAAAAAVIIVMAYRGELPWLAVLLPVALLFLAFKASVAIRSGIGDRPRLTTAIESTLAIHTLGCVWLTAWAVYLFITN